LAQEQRTVCSAVHESAKGNPTVVTNLESRSRPKLSICISTWNRADFIGATLDSILPQLTDDCEVVVVDPASSDNTEQVMSRYAECCSRLRYIRQETDRGMDGNYDRAVELACGEYCWLMSNDDFLRPGAVATVLRALNRSVSLVLVNVETRDFTMTRVRNPRWLDWKSDRVYGPDEMDRLFVESEPIIRFIGCPIIKRQLWLDRLRQPYYGTWWVYVGVIFQKPLPGDAVVIAEPQVSFRMGNTPTFGTLAGELLLSTWPSLVRSLHLSAAAIGKVQTAEPWKHFWWLLFQRALGLYSLQGYRDWIRPRLGSARGKLIPILAAIIPIEMATWLMTIYYILRPRGSKLHYLRDRRFYRKHWVANKKLQRSAGQHMNENSPSSAATQASRTSS
jgi:abequosyltransferase